jgi:large conductance mechanosensitive channel
MKKFADEFKQFALKGNVMSLAVGLIIGMAFQGMITSFTDNILSPLIGLFIRQNFDTLEWSFFGVTLYYGAFITSVINFLILALVVFLMVRTMNRILAEKEEDEPKHPCKFCMTELHENAIRCHACTSILDEAKFNTQ